MKWSTFKRSGPARQTTANRPAVRVWAAAGPFNCLADRRGSSREPIYRPMPRRPPRAARVVCAIRLPAAEGRLKPYVRPLRGCPPLRFAGDTAHPRRGWHLLGRSPSDGPMPRRPPRAARVVCAIRLPAAESRLKPYVRPLRGCLPLRLAGDTAHPRRGSHLLGRSLSMGRCRAGGCSGQSWRARKLFPWWR